MRRWAFGCLLLAVGMTLGLLLAILLAWWVTVEYTSAPPTAPSMTGGAHTRTVAPRPAAVDVGPMMP